MTRTDCRRRDKTVPDDRIQLCNTQGVARPSAEPDLVAACMRVWGFTPIDARIGLATAQNAPGAHRWKVVEETTSVGPPRTLRPGDPAALAQGANYEWIWAVYPAGPTVVNPHDTQYTHRYL
jgi:hypothetical protein